MRTRDCGVEENGIAAQLESGGDVGCGAKAGVNNDRDTGAAFD
jgi:hypothetical protein